MVNKYLILEFPTEKDVKAMKWVNMSGRVKNEEYTEEKFKKYASGYFKDIQDIGRVSKHRPIYLLTK